MVHSGLMSPLYFMGETVIVGHYLWPCQDLTFLDLLASVGLQNTNEPTVSGQRGTRTNGCWHNQTAYRVSLGVVVEMFAMEHFLRCSVGTGSEARCFTALMRCRARSRRINLPLFTFIPHYSHAHLSQRRADGR